MQGWISVYRELLNKPIWTTSTPEQKTVLMTIMLMVNHEANEWEFKGEKFIVERGQMITSLESIVKNCGKGVTIQNVRTSLKRFENYGFLTNESTNKNRLITIVNYGIYQHSKDETNKQTNKQLTSNQQATNKQLTTNNNDNNINNEINTTTKQNAFQFYEQNFGMIAPFTVGQINSWLDDFNNQDEILIYAMQIALERNKKSWGYVQSILKDWFGKNAKSLSDCEALQNEFNSKIRVGVKSISKNEVDPELGF